MKKFLKIAGIVVGVLLIVLIVGILVMFRHGFQSIELSAFALPEQKAQSWDEVFQQPAPVKVIPFNTGHMEADRYPQNPPDAQDRYEPMDVPAFGVRHERFGDLLIDSGFDESFSSNPPFGNYPFLAQVFLKAAGLDNISQEKGHDILSRLKQHQLDPQKVFFTHSHFDHTAGVPALARSTELVMDAREFNFLAKAGGHFNGIKEVKTLDWSKAEEMPPLGPCLDLFGDGSFWAISTPGHAPGHTSYLVNTKTGPVLITGDAVFFHWGFANGVGSEMFDMDKEQAQKSREQLLVFTKQYPQVKVFVGHEL